MLSKSAILTALYASAAILAVVNASPVNVRYGRDPGHKSPPGDWPGPGWNKQTARAIYFMTNLPSNSIVALPVAEDSSVSAGTTTSTEGAGGNLVDPVKGTKNGPDALGSQGSVQVVGDLLLAVNPGSDSVSIFEISSEDPTQLTLLGSPASTTGNFPVTIGISSSLGIACVGYSGVLSGVSCASYSSTGLGAFDALRSIPLGQTDPATGPGNGIADVFFTDDQDTLIVIVKGDGTSAHPGFITLYPVTNGEVSYSSSAETHPAETAVMFGSTTIPGTNNIFVSDATFGAVILSLSDLSTPLALTNITDQMATCWAITSSVTGTGFVDDVLVSQLTEVDLTTGAIVSEVNCGNDNQGMIDMRAVGDRIYALSPGNGTLPAAVTVFDISGGRGSAKPIQNFPVYGADKNAEGLAWI